MIATFERLQDHSPDDLATALFVVFQECWHLMDDDQRKKLNSQVYQRARQLEQGETIHALDLKKNDANVADILRTVSDI